MNLITEIDYYQIFEMFMLLLISMEPKIANLLLNGILDKKASPKDYVLESIGIHRHRA